MPEDNKLTAEQVAVICHQTNKAYCESQGDTSQKNYDDSPQWQKDSALLGVRHVVGILDQGKNPEPSASHESWLQEKKDEGWKYGPEKNAETKEHPCFVSYDELPASQKAKDFLFIGVVTALYRAGMVKSEQ